MSDMVNYPGIYQEEVDSPEDDHGSLPNLAEMSSIHISKI